MKQMKKIKSATGKWAGMLGLAAMVFVLCGMFSVSAYAKSSAYVLECRGGGEMNATVYKNGEVAIKGFRSARTAASARPPGPGECAWLDRPMRRDEPKELWDAHRKSPLAFVTMRRGYKYTISLMDTARYPIITVLDAIMGGQVFLVHVRQVRITHGSRQILRIERIGP